MTTFKGISISEMSLVELVATYNALAKTPVRRFSSRAVGLRRVCKLIAAPEKPAAAPEKPAAVRHYRRSTVWVAPATNPTHFTEYRSVWLAFVELSLPLGVHKRFRRTVKLNQRADFTTPDGKTFTFTTIPPNSKEEVA